MFNHAFTHFFIHFDQDTVYIVENTGHLLDQLTELNPAPNLTEIILSYSTHLKAKGHVQFTFKAGLQFYHVTINKNKRNEYFDGYILDSDYFHLYDINETVLSRRFQILSSLKNALRRKEFHLEYQPIIEAGHDEQRLLGVEALLRWNHPQLGNVSPAELIPVLEQSNYIHEVGYWILEQSAMDLKKLNTYYSQRIVGHVNISANQLMEPSFSTKLVRILKKCSLDPSLLVLEITEHNLITASNILLQNIEELIQLGVKIVIDDFGTGYSSLQTLSKLPISGIKIDREFVTNLFKSKKDEFILEIILDIAKKLNIEIVAEGIEDEATAAALLRKGCTFHQGYFYSKPLEKKLLEQYIYNHRKHLFVDCYHGDTR